VGRHLRRQWRLLALAAALVVVWVVMRATGSQPSAHDLREWGREAGALGPIVFVPLGVALSSCFVPFPLIGGVAGALFGVAGGTVISIITAVTAAVTQMSITKLVAKPRADPGHSTLQHFLSERGILAAFYVRLLPGLPFVPVNYAAGATALKRRHMAIGTGLAGGPRAFAYAALGGSFSDLSRPQAKIAIAVLVAMAVIGLLLARRNLGAGLRDAREAAGRAREAAQARSSSATAIPAPATETADHRSAL
jgi:uncharacterized membrane protein YdjX (TVP38/TMEM64 family)